eukprot:1436-Heterococcus_DN1.PRE.2
MQLIIAVMSVTVLNSCDTPRNSCTAQRQGWTHARERPACGSVMSIAWTADGTQLVGGGGNGTVVYAQVIGRSLDWDRYEAVLVESHKIAVQDVGSDTKEVLDFARDRVVEMALGHGHLVVATATQCFIYAVTNWNTPHIFDLRGAVSLIALAPRHFLTVDALAGVQVWSYDGRPISSPRLPNLRAEFLNRYTIALGQAVALVQQYIEIVPLPVHAHVAHTAALPHIEVRVPMLCYSICARMFVVNTKS